MAFGFTCENAEYDWMKERLTEYNVGRISGYAERRAQFLRFPEEHSGETRLFRARAGYMTERALDTPGPWKGRRYCEKRAL